MGSEGLAVEQASILRCRQPIKEFGFVYSLAQIEGFIAKKDNEAFLNMLRQEAGVGQAVSPDTSTRNAA